MGVKQGDNLCLNLFKSVINALFMYLNSSADPVFELKPNQLLDELLYSSGDGLQYKLNILQQYCNEFLKVVSQYYCILN